MRAKASLRALAVCIFVAFSTWACGSNLAGEGYSGPPVGKIAGRVTSQAGGPVAGVTVSDGTHSAVTDAKGNYLLKGVSPNPEIRLRFDHDSYLRSYSTTTIRGWETATLNVVLAPFAASQGQTFNIAQGVRAVADRSDGHYVVQIPPNGVADGKGNPVTGDVTIVISPISAEASPGDLTGIVKQNGKSCVVPLLSFKMTDVTLMRPGESSHDDSAQWKKALNLAPGVKAQVELPIPGNLPASQVPNVGDQIPWWWWDPAVGHWVEDCVGTVKPATSGSGLAFFAEWTHFSRHGVLVPDAKELRRGLPAKAPLLANADKLPPQNLTCVSGTVSDTFNNPLPGAQVFVTGTSTITRQQFTSDENGKYKAGALIVGESVTLEADLSVDGEIYKGTASYTVPSPALGTGYDLDMTNADCPCGPNITIQVCYSGGNVQLAVQTVVTPGSLNANLLPSGKAQLIKTVSQYGMAGFNEPAGAPEACPKPAADIPQDSCVKQDKTYLQDIPGAVPPGFDVYGNKTGTGSNTGDDGVKALSVGPYVSLTGPDKFMLPVVDPANPISYALGAADSKAKGAGPTPGSYDLGAPGAKDGIAAFSSPKALVMPSTPVLANADDLTIDRTQSLTVKWDKGSTASPLTLIVTQDGNSSTAVICNAQDDGSFTVPAGSLSALQTGAASITLLRTSRNAVRLPPGTYVHTTGSASSLIHVMVK